MSAPAVLLPDTAGFREAVASFSVLRTPSPAAAVVARDVAAVSAAVRHAAASGRRVAAFTTGHAAGRLGTLDDALLVRVVLDEPVTVDPGARTARVPAGALWRDVVAAAAPHGLLAPHGSSGTVGAVGHLLNGGLGFTAREVGVASNSVLAVEYVDADGDLRTADAEREPDRFWALRGGGAGIGVVTAVVVALHPGRTVHTGVRIFGVERTEALLRHWRDWCADAPRAITTTARILHLPPLPHLPAVLTSGPVLAVDGVALGDGGEAVAATLLDGLSAVAAPLLDTWHTGPAVDALQTHMDPPEPAPAWTAHDLLEDLTDEVIGIVLDAALSRSPLLFHELRQLGGAIAHPERPGGFFDRIPEPFLFDGVAIAPQPEVLAAAQEHVAELRRRLGRAVGERSVPTFLEDAESGRLAAGADGMARLQRVRAAADPSGRFAVRP